MIPPPWLRGIGHPSIYITFKVIRVLLLSPKLPGIILVLCKTSDSGKTNKYKSAASSYSVTFLSGHDIKNFSVDVLLVHPVISAGVPHSESHRSLDWWNDSPLSNICHITAVQELNVLLHNILPIISPNASIHHQSGTLADLLSNAIWLSSVASELLRAWNRATGDSHRSVLNGTIKKVINHNPDISMVNSYYLLWSFEC